MVHLSRPSLSTETVTDLSVLQNSVDTAGSYADRVSAAKSKFKSKNTKTDRTFKAIKKELKEMCPGQVRCHYCEDSAPDEVEHFYPKDLYPEFCFSWDNYLYSCGPCNGSYKRHKFKIFASSDKAVTDVTRAHKAPITPPTPGTPVLIDPSADDPMEYMELDLSQTFLFIVSAPSGTQKYERASYTIELLGLNSRDDLAYARNSAFGSFRARLREYVEKKEAGAALSELRILEDGIHSMAHMTVWEEMKRQKDYNSPLHSELRTLFEKAPELL